VWWLKTQDPRPFPSMFCGGAFFCFWRARAVLTHSLRWYVIRPSAPLWLDLHFANKTTPTQVKRQVPNLFPEVDWLSCDRGLLPRLNIRKSMTGREGPRLQPPFTPLDGIKSATLFISFSIRPILTYGSSLSLSLSPFFTYRPALPSNICHSYALE
jgi:hypothetical protein